MTRSVFSKELQVFAVTVGHVSHYKSVKTSCCCSCFFKEKLQNCDTVIFFLRKCVVAVSPHSLLNSPLSVHGGRGEGIGLCFIPFIFSPFNTHLEFQVRTVYLSAGTSPLGGFSSPCISIVFSFQSQNPVEIYNIAKNLVPSLSGYISGRLWWKRLCQNNTAGKTPRTQLAQREREKM